MHLLMTRSEEKMSQSEIRLKMNSRGNDNTAIGESALLLNTTGSSNTATGDGAMLNNSVGVDNTAYGVNALLSNIAGSNATAIGTGAMFFANHSTAPFINYNVALGYYALSGPVNLNNTGNFNTALGYQTLFANSTGNNNTAAGYLSLDSNATGNSNTGYGALSLYSNRSGSFNTAIGYTAIYVNSTGSYNSALGYNVFFTTGALNNTACIGYNSGGIVNATNRIEIGNSSISVIAGQVGFSTYSDARIKDNVKEDVPGLAFISRLRPVTYNLNIHKENAMVYKGTKKDDADWDGKYDLEKVKMTGFLAQDVEKAAKEAGYDFSGVQKPANPDELYSLRYSDFVMPLVKSVQELSDENAQLKNEIAQIKAVMTIEQQQKLNELKNTNQPRLEQNSPNPFTSQTEIKFQLPAQFNSAQIIISDGSGKQIRTYNLQTSAPVVIKASELSAGMYSYLLIVDGITVDSKQMILTK
jgi:hypothetical protein